MLDGLSCGDRLSTEIFRGLRELAARDAFKWNVTDHGRESVCDFPLLLSRSLWSTLSDWAVRLAAEALRAEREIAARPALQAAAGVPRALRHGPRSEAAPGAGPRYARFDFHPTADGRFAITEGNLDVAGGWNEAGGVAAIFARHAPGAVVAGDPAAALAARLARRVGAGRTIGIMHLTRYTEDHQVARFLGREFDRHGLETVFFDPTQLRSCGPRARAGALVDRCVRPLDAIFRFFPAEWACRLARCSEWLELAAKPETLWVNPISTVFTQSKRFPLTWRHLQSDLSTWSRLLPETRTPAFLRSGQWVLKPAFGHEGDRVAIDGVTDRGRRRWLWWRARAAPWRWAAQRSFGPAPIQTPVGPRFPCIGVFVVDGEPAGLYGRLAERPLIDDRSQDVVILLRR